MEDFQIRFAIYEDIPMIMQFIEEYWRKGHILARDRVLFEWQYINYNKLNFVVGIDGHDNIQGVLGFIPYSEGETKDISLALWKANHCEYKPFLGIELMMFLMNQEDYKDVVCPGINLETTPKIYEYLGMTVGTMEQWYRLCDKRQYVIGRITNRFIPMIQSGREYSFEVYHDFSKLDGKFDFEKYANKSKPYKSKSYFSKRYFNHPRYDYKVIGINNELHEVISIIVLRIQEYDGTRVIRFVDFIGEVESLAHVTIIIDNLLVEWNAEYIDMYEVGLPESILIGAGWLPVKNSGNIIPNYFSPYELCNVEISYCSSDADVVLFRGDGDQDRPS